jgi:glycosyltransferase involved in cell wall biosynthesis
MSELISILIPIGPNHQEEAKKLIDFLKEQATPEVEIIPYLNEGEKTKGYYRNQLLSWAKGKYVAFVDADDWLSENYCELLLEAIKTNPTHVSLKGVITTDGQDPQIFEHSNKYSSWKTTHSGIDVKYERTINHLNTIRADIAKQFKFPEINHGEDHRYSEMIHNSGLLTDEYYMNVILYHYRYKTKK